MCQGHIYWGLTSILFMFLPFAMDVGMLISESILGKARLRQFSSVLLRKRNNAHFPSVLMSSQYSASMSVFTSLAQKDNTTFSLCCSVWKFSKVSLCHKH